MWADETAQTYAQATAAQWDSITRPLMAHVALKQNMHAGRRKRLKLGFSDEDLPRRSQGRRGYFIPRRTTLSRKRSGSSRANRAWSFASFPTR